MPSPIELDLTLRLPRRRGGRLDVRVTAPSGTTLADLLPLVEELVGDLRDEHDRTRTGIVRDGRAVIFDASLRPDELIERTGIKVPVDGEYETVAGFVTDELDRIPEVGDEVEVDHGTLRVERVEGNRVDRLRFTPIEVEPGESEHDVIMDALRGDEQKEVHHG